MHVLFVHQNFPAQFGHIAAHLARGGWRCSFISETDPGVVDGIRKIQYRPHGGATAQTHYFSRTFENQIWHAAGVYETLEPLRKTLRPDLIVGHSGFGLTFLLPELFPNVPVINYFEYFYHPRGSDMDFRSDFPVAEADILRARARNALHLMDLEYCTAGYAPTEFQRSLFPAAYQPKLRVIHDGIDTDFWRRHDEVDRRVGDYEIPEGARVVTYVSRGLESMRGFDIFMRAAKKVYEEFSDVVFLVVGSEGVAYGGDLKYIAEESFKAHVLAQDDYDLERIRFLGQVDPPVLVNILSVSDLHIYLTVPFVLSWSLLDAMACECIVLASDTAPVREVIRDGENGLLRDFFDVDAFATAALDVIRHPESFRHLGEAAERTIRDRYSLRTTLPVLASFYEDVAAARVDKIVVPS